MASGTDVGIGANSRQPDRPIGPAELPSASSPAELVYHQICSELSRDGQPPLNLASFVTTSMDDRAQQLALGQINKNLVNHLEYAQTDLIHQRVVRMTANLFHAEVPAGEFPLSATSQRAQTGSDFIGTTTAGSSEAIMLALLAHKWNWKRRNKANSNRSPKDQPYLIIGTNTHACFEKFARYFDVKVKRIVLDPDQFFVTAEQVETILKTPLRDDPQIMADCGYTAEEVGDRQVSELVTAIGCVVCNTFTADADDVSGIDQMLTACGWEIPIHVDAASGGFILPFTDSDDAPSAFEWDFRVPHVQSINVSNHKFGLVYPGLGTLVFRNAEVVPDELFVDIDYLCGDSRSYSLNFSRPSAGVLMQYYNFLRLGTEGYRRIIEQCLASAQHLANELQTSDTLGPYFDLVSDTQRFPVVVFRFKPGLAATVGFTLAEVAEVLRQRGWLVPAYPLPATAEPVEVMRLVVKENVTAGMARAFIRDLTVAIERLVDRTQVSDSDRQELDDRARPPAEAVFQAGPEKVLLACS